MGKKINNATIKELDQLLTTEEVATLLNVTYTTIRNWMDAGKIDYKVIEKGTKKRVIRFELDKLKKQFNL